MATGSGFRVPGSEFPRASLFSKQRGAAEPETRNQGLQPSRRYAREFQLVIFTEGPRFYAASAQVLGEL
jgi:hypothetical protein